MSILEIKNIIKEYSNGKQALKDVSLSIEEGEFIALLGPNGAGKSTLINIIGDVVKKTSGTLVAAGINFDEDKNNFKRQFGIVPQEINIDPFSTPYESLKFQQGAFGLKFNKQAILDTLEAVGLKDQIHSNSRSLSGGMKRRVLVAKAIISDPKILILDEPTAGVDIELRQHLWQLLKELNKQGKTIILTTHYLEEAEYLCDKIAIINKGKLINYEDKKSLIAKIGSKTLEIEIRGKIENKDILTGFNYKYDDNMIYIAYKDDNEVGEILKILVSKGVVIYNINNKVSSLEEVFLKLTK